MRDSVVYRLILAAALAAGLAGCQSESQDIPVLTAKQASQLSPSQLPRIWRDPSPYLSYPYNIHETDGLSRNPDDCARWGCIDNMAR
jgi:hypothetical protein